MLVLGLTGSIGMGKTATAALFRRRGVPVHDADAAVHALYAGAAVPLIDGAFPGAVRDGVVDRALLGAQVLGNGLAMHRLERIVHPLVRDAETAFLAQMRRAGHRLAVIDVPLLLESGWQGRCDVVVVVSAREDAQRRRVLERPGMTAARLDAILARQMPDADKRRLAHAVILTDRGFEPAQRQVDSLLAALAGIAGRPLSSMPPTSPAPHPSILPATD